jgi:hypothetical protein
MSIMSAWLEGTIEQLDALGSEACLRELVAGARTVCRSAWLSRWWEAPIGLIEDPSATAEDALAYAEVFLAIGRDGLAEELIHTVLRVALGASPFVAGPRLVGAERVVAA